MGSKEFWAEDNQEEVNGIKEEARRSTARLTQFDETDERPLSLHPLSFDEAVTDILKVTPEAKKKKRKEKEPNTP
jgi:hypothetical protein